VGDGARERLETSKAFLKLANEQREELVGVVGGLVSVRTIDRAEALAAATAINGELSKVAEKVLLQALAVRDPEAPALDDPDPELRDQENVPLPDEPVTLEPDPSRRLASERYKRAVEEYMAAEVLPHVPDAWVDHSKTKIGYEIPLTRHFYKYAPPRPIRQIDAEIRALEEEIQELLSEVTE
jgi:type I restriction enzyme M protein